MNPAILSRNLLITGIILMLWSIVFDGSAALLFFGAVLFIAGAILWPKSTNDNATKPEDFNGEKKSKDTSQPAKVYVNKSIWRRFWDIQEQRKRNGDFD